MKARLIRTGAMVVGLMLAIAPTAAATDWIYALAPDSGTSAYTYHSDGYKKFNVYDRLCDGYSGHGEYQTNNGGSGSLDNNDGCKTHAYKYVSYPIVLVKACTNRPFPEPDQCSGWHGVSG